MIKTLLPLVVALLVIGINLLQQSRTKPEVTPTNLIPGATVVKRVIDGDTIELTDGTTVRYLGMDTPETVDPLKPVQCFGKEAKAKNAELVLNQEVKLVADVENADRYGRLLRYVYVGDTFVNLELVKQGYAYSYPYPPNVSREAEFRAAQAEARVANRGLWAGCTEKDIGLHLRTQK